MRASVQKIVKKYNETVDVVDKKESGCPKKLSLHNEQFLKITALQNRKKAQRVTEKSWDKVLFTDESKFQILGTNRHQYVRQRKGEALKEPCLASTIRHGLGNIQVWGCISIKGIGDIVRITEKLTGEKYKNILHNHTVPSGQQLIGDYFILQQDNDPKHTCKLVKIICQIWKRRECFKPCLGLLRALN